ncbi:lactate dehydrogenase [Cellulomonas sp. C5510]|uniref:lactate/malate family dehydrogenase n=1 Tax=Cellulomonas sp. C5510 TaxID=2871170 RepID=UPI001C97FD44|nr:lactate dehydrogenase [Cellulomonas sp. C5510]QZN85726.1 lactate dehydrogenase [Cellulomonas sp. C5510]
MDVAVLGATGDVGRQVCAQLIERRVLPTTSRLQLVGRHGGASGRATYGLRADLVDAYDEHAPLIDVALDPEDVVADVVVLTAGRTAPARAGASTDRAALAAGNLAVFESYARAIARYGSGHEVVVVVSNPVELAVAVVARELGRHRVIGMGAWLDTLRFRRETAVSLGVRRHRVGGFVAGQHGDDLVPLWSTVRISGLDVEERRRAVARLRGGRTLDGFGAEIEAAKQELAVVGAHDAGRAFALVDTWPADLRAVARPWLTHQSGAKTASATAAATVDLVDTILDGRETVVAGQVDLAGEVSVAGRPVHGVLGVPVVLGPEGWTRVLLDELPPDEERRLAAVAGRIGAAVAGWRAEAARAATSTGPDGAGPAETGAAPDATAPAAPAGTDPDPGAAAVAPGTMPAGVAADASDPDETPWTAHVVADHRTGTIAALSAVFATRGVNFDALTTAYSAGDAGTVVIRFRADARRCRALERAIARLAVVRSVGVAPAGDEPC